jgi:hypothetical protein
MQDDFIIVFYNTQVQFTNLFMDIELQIRFKNILFPKY